MVFVPGVVVGFNLAIKAINFNPVRECVFFKRLRMVRFLRVAKNHELASINRAFGGWRRMPIMKLIMKHFEKENQRGARCVFIV